MEIFKRIGIVLRGRDFQGTTLIFFCFEFIIPYIIIFKCKNKNILRDILLHKRFKISGSFLPALRFSPPIKLTPHDITEILLKVALNTKILTHKISSIHRLPFCITKNIIKMKMGEKFINNILKIIVLKSKFSIQSHMILRNWSTSCLFIPF